MKDLEFADDAALPDRDIVTANNRNTNINSNAQEEAGMCISVPKTKVQHTMKRPQLTETTEEDITNLPTNLQFQHQCDKCSMSYPSKHCLSVHKGRWCKGRKRPSHKGTVADHVVQRHKFDEFQKTLDKVKLDGKDLDNEYSFVNLGAEIAGIR